MINNEISEIEGIIIEAASNVILKQGIDTATMGQIADEAGISRTSLNYYFKDKNQLYHKVIENLEYKVVPTVSRLIINENLTLLEKIDLFIDEYIVMIKKYPMVPSFILEEARRDPNLILQFFKRRNLIFEKLNEQIEKEVLQGNVKPFQLPDLFANMMGLCAFPMLSKPLLMEFFFNGNEAEFSKFLNSRNVEVKKMIHSWLKPEVAYDCI